MLAHASRGRQANRKDIRMRKVFITGGTGYIGNALIASLRDRAHEVRALVRPGSKGKLPPGCPLVFGDALRHESYAAQVPA